MVIQSLYLVVGFLIFTLPVIGEEQLLVDSAYAQSDSDFEDSLFNPRNELTKEDTSHSPKVHPLIAKWQSASNQEEFANANALAYSDGKISVYIHLDNANSISQISEKIDVRASDENIAVAFVSSNQIDQLIEMDFVERIKLPDMARMSSLQNETMMAVEEEEEDGSMAIAVITVSSIIIGISIIAVFAKYRKRCSHS